MHKYSPKRNPLCSSFFINGDPFSNIEFKDLHEFNILNDNHTILNVMIFPVLKALFVDQTGQCHNVQHHVPVKSQRCQDKSHDLSTLIEDQSQCLKSH